MRKIGLLIFFASSFPAAASGIPFDSVFAQCELVISGYPVRHWESSLLDDAGTRECYIDFYILQICPGKLVMSDTSNALQPGDTLKGLRYYSSELTDTFTLDSYYYIPVKRNAPPHTRWQMVIEDANAGAFRDPARYSDLCPVAYIIGADAQTKTRKLRHNGKWGVQEICNAEGKMEESVKTKWRTSKRVTVSRRYFSSGKTRDKIRTVHKLKKRGMKTVEWTQRKNGKPVFSRKVYYTE